MDNATTENELWNQAKTLASKTHPMPSVEPAIAGVTGFVTSFLVITIFSGMIGLPLGDHGAAAATTCGLGAVVPFLCIYMAQRRHLAAVSRCYDQLQLVEHNKATRRARFQSPLQP